MRDDLKDARDSVRSMAVGLVPSYDNPVVRDVWPALVKIVQADLAEHPSDDDEDLDCDWLIKVTRPCAEGALLGKIHELSFEIEPGPDGFKLWICHPDKPPVPVRELVTRGEVRRVCRELGLTLSGD